MMMPVSSQDGPEPEKPVAGGAEPLNSHGFRGSFAKRRVFGHLTYFGTKSAAAPPRSSFLGHFCSYRSPSSTLIVP